MTKTSSFRLLLAVSVVIVASSGPVFGQSVAERSVVWTISASEVRADSQQVTFSDNFVPFFDRGYFVLRAQDTKGPDAANVVLLDSRGSRLREVRVWLPGAIRMKLTHAVIAESGEVVAAGYAITSDQGVKYFIARTDLGGQVVTTIETTPFVPRCICLASDGTIWALGLELDKADKHEDYTILRQFSFASGRLAEYLPRSSFGPGISPVAVTATVSVGSRQSTYLRCAGDQVHLYVNSSDEYIRVDPSASAVQRWQMPTSVVGVSKVTGFAVTATGHPFANFKPGPGGEPGLVGTYEIAVGDGTTGARLVRVEGLTPDPGTGVSASGANAPQLWGAEGDGLVVRRPGESRLSWVGLSRTESKSQ